MAFGRDNGIYARIVAFGSQPAIEDYSRLRTVATRTAIATTLVDGGGESAATHRKLVDAEAEFDFGATIVQQRVHEDLG